MQNGWFHWPRPVTEYELCTYVDICPYILIPKFISGCNLHGQILHKYLPEKLSVWTKFQHTINLLGQISIIIFPYVVVGLLLFNICICEIIPIKYLKLLMISPLSVHLAQTSGIMLMFCHRSNISTKWSSPNFWLLRQLLLSVTSLTWTIINSLRVIGYNM